MPIYSARDRTGARKWICDFFPQRLYFLDRTFCFLSVVLRTKILNLAQGNGKSVRYKEDYFKKMG